MKWWVALILLALVIPASAMSMLIPSNYAIYTSKEVQISYCTQCLSVGKPFVVHIIYNNTGDSVIHEIKLHVVATNPDGERFDRWIPIEVDLPPNHSWKGWVNTGIVIDEPGRWQFDVSVYKPWFLMFDQKVGELYVCPIAPVMGDRYCLSIFAFRKSDSKKLCSKPPALQPGESLIIRGWVDQTIGSGLGKHCDIPIGGKTVCAYIDNHKCVAYATSDSMYMFYLVVKPSRDLFDGGYHKLTIYVVQDPKARYVYTIKLGGGEGMTKISTEIVSVSGYAIATSAIVLALVLRYMGKI